jgi:hypothetical protein
MSMSMYMCASVEAHLNPSHVGHARLATVTLTGPRIHGPPSFAHALSTHLSQSLSLNPSPSLSPRCPRSRTDSVSPPLAWHHARHLHIARHSRSHKPMHTVHDRRYSTQSAHSHTLTRAAAKRKDVAPHSRSHKSMHTVHDGRYSTQSAHSHTLTRAAAKRKDERLRT